VKNLSIVIALAVVSGAGCRAKDSASPLSSLAAESVAMAEPSTAQDTLDAMDTRTPVPLVPMMANHQKQNMREHLEAVQQIVAAIGVKDFAAIDKAASRIGFSEQMGQMCTHMGAGAPGFSEAALNFHHTADAIGVAAKKHDLEGALTALGTTLATCTSCHAKFKQHVVDDAAWGQSTKQPATHPAHR
jgi:hypothetical protein